MTRETFLATINSVQEFRHKHPVLSITLSLLVTAACAGGLYLIIVNFPRFIPCFSGAGCQ